MLVSPFELSRSAPLNELIRAASQSAENAEDRALDRELSARLKFMAVFVDQLRQHYKSSKELRPPSPLMKELDGAVRADMDRLKAGLKRVNRWFTDRRPEHLREGCVEAREAADRLLGHFDRLRVEEESFPVFSDSPPVNELVQVAMGVARGHAPEEALRVRLEAFYKHWKKTVADSREWVRAPVENEQVAALAPQVKVGMDLMTRGLRVMSQYFSGGNKDHLKKGCEIVLQASEGLLELRRRIVEAAEPTLSCPRCSTRNQPGTRSCSKCGARLPDLPGAPTSTVEVSSQAPGQPRFAYLIRLEEAVDAYLEKRIAREDLKQTVDWFAGNVRQGKRNLEALKPPAQYPSEEVRQGAEDTRKLMDEGSQCLLEGVEILEGYFASPERDRLEGGLEWIRRGAALMAEAQERMRALGFGPPGA